MLPGEGRIWINKRPFENYFKLETHRLIINQPLEIAQAKNKYDLRVNVKGGGIGGQAGAVRHAIARALAAIDENLKKLMKKEGFLTRDPRAKERKKYGRKRARRRFQYSKR
jgi:small subunit ribosomal protein S9